MTNEVFELDTKAQEAVRELLGGGDTQAEFLALKTIFETDFDLVIESDNLDDLIAEVQSYFDTTQVIPLNSTLSATAFKNVLEKYLGTLNIDIADSEEISLGIVGTDNGSISLIITNGKNAQDVDITNVIMSGYDYSLSSEQVVLIPQITNLEDILNNQDVITYLNSGVLSYFGESVVSGLQIDEAVLCNYTNDLTEEKRVKPTDILSMFNAPSPNAE